MGGPRVILVTGALGGIGSAIVSRFASQGDLIAVTDLAEAADVPPGAAYLSADLSVQGESERLVAQVVERFGRVDVLVNNAGLQKVSPVTTFDPDDWALVRTLSLDVPFALIRASLPGMLERRWGRVLNIASAHGLVASPFKSAYVAAKHGLIGLTRTVALETAEHGVTVNAICPGYVYTPLVERQITDQMAAHRLTRDAVIRDVILASQPTKRFIDPLEVADLAVYLASDSARSITGAALSIDGGWTAR